MPRDHRFSIRLTPDLTEGIFRFCADKGVTKSEVFRMAVGSYLESGRIKRSEVPAETVAHNDPKIIGKVASHAA